MFPSGPLLNWKIQFMIEKRVSRNETAKPSLRSFTSFQMIHTHTSFSFTHTCSETSYRITDVECIVRAKTLQLNLTDTVKTVPFCGETERITKMMWPPALQQHPGASLRFFFLARRTESPNDVTTSFATASRCVNTVPCSWRDGQNHQMMWPPAMQQHPGASLRFHFMARRTESPNDVTTSYATASRCVTTVPFHGETDRITKWCDHQLCNSIQVHHYGSISWRDG